MGKIWWVLIKIYKMKNLKKLFLALMLFTVSIGYSQIETTISAPNTASVNDSLVAVNSSKKAKHIPISTLIARILADITHPIATGGGSPTVDNIQEYLDNTGSSGFFLGGGLSDGGGGTLDVAAGSGFIRTTNDNNAELQSFKWIASNTMGITDNTTQYVYVDDSGVVSLSTDEFLEAPDKIQIGVVTKESGVIDHVFSLGVRLEESIGQAGRFIRRVHGITRDKRKGGLIMGQSGDANRDVTMTEGILWWGRTEYPESSFDTSGADTFITYSAGGQEDATASQWNNLQYDNSGTLTTLSNNSKWANLFFFLEPDGHVIMIYGRAEFSSEALADLEGVPSSSLPTRISETSILISRFTFQKSSNTATISSAFADLFANAGTANHGDLAGLSDDDHPQYTLVDGTRAFTGDVDLGTNNITNIGNVLADSLKIVGGTNLEYLLADGSVVTGILTDSTVVGTPFEETDVSATWLSGLTFDVRADKFPVDGIYYSATQANVVLDAADGTFDRIDLITANTSGAVGEIAGTASANPAEPNFEASTTYPIKFVLVKASQTTPDGFSNELVFDENVGQPTEWDTTLTANLAVTTNDPHSGANSIEGTTTSNDISKFETASDITSSNINVITFWIKLKADFGSSVMYVSLYDDGTRTKIIKFRSGKHGFDSSSLVYQQITIDFSRLNYPNGEIDQVWINPSKNGFAGYFIDLVQFQFNTVVVNPDNPNTDEQVKISANDTNSGYLNGKLVAGTNVTLVENNDGGNETLTINSTTTGELNDLSSIVTWANVPDANITESSVTQHQAALSITASQVSDFDTEVSNNSSVTANTAKVTNATHTSEVTGDTALTIASGVVDTDNLATELKAESAISALDVDWSDGIHFTKTLVGNTILTFSNFTVGKTISLEIDGNFTLTLPAGVEGDLSGFDGALTNIIQLYCVDAGTPKFITSLINY